MSYFGWPIDTLQSVASEISATAPMAPEVSEAMDHLADRLLELSPLFEELCQYFADRSDADKVQYLMQHLAQKAHHVST